MLQRERRLLSCSISSLLIVAFASLVWLLATQTVADADLWGHLRFGLDVLHTHRLPQWDSYSFTADRAWVNHEWLSELVMAVAYRAAGPLGLNLLKMLSIAAIALVMIAVGRSERAPSAHYLVLTILVILGTYTRTQVIRPQLFSVTMFCVLLYCLRSAEGERSRALVFVPLCFAIWVNLHGGWIVGFACFSLWVLATAWTLPAKRPMLFTVWLAAAGATLLNPYGLGMWSFVLETVRPTRAQITDWKPLVQLPAGIIVLDLVLPALAVCAVLLGRQRIRWRELVIISFLAWGTWRVGRVDAFLAAAIGILLAPQLLRGSQAIAARLRARIWHADVPFAGLLAGSALAVALVAGLLQLRTITLEGAWLPDAAAVESVRQACPGKNVLTWFDWGEYAIWHLSPQGIRVSIDGRRETVYSQTVLDQHSAFYRNERVASDYPDRIAAECAWLPARLAAVSTLQARGWTVVARTETSAVLSRSALNGSAWPPQTTAGPRLFPGP